MKDKECDVELSHEEEELLRSLNQELAPPADLESQVVDALRRRDLLRPTRRPGIYLRPWQLLAASLAVAVLGFQLGRWRVAERADLEPELPRFLLLLYEDPSAPTSPETAQRQFEEYAAWAGELRREGSFEAGDPIAPEGRLLREVDGDVHVVEGLEPEGGEVLSGYFLIRAHDADEALRLARQCPHLRYDGTVAMRPVGGN